MSQANQILEYLQGGGKITALSALEYFKCFRLAARIHDLKKKGHAIECEMFTVQSGKSVARYYMAGA